MAKDPFISKAARQTMLDLGLSESYIFDVFHKGEHQKTKNGWNLAVKKYSSDGYEVRLLYTEDSFTYGYRIVKVWKNRMR